MTQELTIKQKIGGLILATFFLAVSMAQFAYIQSTYLNQFFTIEFLGLIFFIAYLLTFFSTNLYTNYIVKLGNLKTVIIATLIDILSFVIFIYSTNIYLIIIAFILYVISTNLIAVNFDIFLEAYTDNEKTGKLRGIYYTIYNLGWLLSPLIAGEILDNFGYNSLFGLTIILTLIFLFILIYSFRHFQIRIKAQRFYFKKTFAAIKADRNIRKIFFIAFLLQIFYAVMVLYTPLYLNQYIGLTWPQIGFVFTIMLLPFVLLQYPAGYIADKYIGEKEMMTAGLIIMAATSIAIFFIDTPGIVLWAVILFLSRVGASLVEIMRDTYFFKKVDVENIDLINSFRSTTPVAHILVPLGVTLLLFYLPFNYIFLILGLFLTSGLTFVLTIKDTK
jgi:MFS family permease